PNIESFRQGMSALGYVQGRNFVLEVRYAHRDYARLPSLVQELLAAKVELIVTGGASSRAAPFAAQSVPVVFGFSGDPVEGKIVQSFAHPGGNATGMSHMSFDLVGKRMEMLRETMPGTKRVAIIANPHHPGEQGELRVSTAAAKSLGLAIDYHEVRNEVELENAFAAIFKSHCDAIDAFPDAFTMRHSDKIAAFTVKTRIPAISGWAQFAERGNLMSYGPNLRDAYRRLANFVDKIARGAKPADLPVELPTSVEMVVNMKTAKAIAINVPNSILVRADRVIE
ncbi:MAG TPA: ABC transporter substrate-binding protein, partial [Burkholderiales bacterium]|nr:ABC transporter substrate-binding protein [Burkholderiales bacterium]